MFVWKKIVGEEMNEKEGEDEKMNGKNGQCQSHFHYLLEYEIYLFSPYLFSISSFPLLSFLYIFLNQT